MNNLLSRLKVKEFDTLLDAYRMAGFGIGNAIDGGAGSGLMSELMAKHLPSDGTVFAFEPFPGNHRFFEGLDPKIKLCSQALAEAPKHANFMVPTVVAEGTVWGNRGLVGYSSVGFLAAQRANVHCNIQVECVRADDIIDPRIPIGFVKLDLQGGELNALKGMSRILNETSFMWVEFISAENGLLEFLTDAGYVIFDTAYLFMGQPSEAALREFDVLTADVALSTNAKAWYGFKKRPWENFKAEFASYRGQFGMLQTDLVCINQRKMDQFLSALAFLPAALTKEQ